MSDLLTTLGYDAEDPRMIDAYTDESIRMDLIYRLVIRRQQLTTPVKMAISMGVSFQDLAEFERLGGDQTLSMIQGYARALGCRIEINAVTDPARTEPGGLNDYNEDTP